jgi:hypothetical protein
MPNMCVYVCRHVCIYVCIYIYIYICVCVCVCVYACTFIHLKPIPTDTLGTQCKIWTSINVEFVVIEYTPSVLILGFTG